MSAIPDVVLQGDKMHSLSDFYSQIAKEMKLPDWFGRNLDALNDVIQDVVHESSPPAGPRVVWKEHAAAKKVLGEDFNEIMEVFQSNEIKVVLE